MTLLSIIQTVCGEVGIPVPNAAAKSLDPQIQQLVALANREGRELASHPVKDACWSVQQNQNYYEKVSNCLSI